MRNPEFFSVDILGIHHTFYAIPMQKATGENPVEILSRARRSYRGYSFTITDLRDKIHGSGTRDMAAESTVQRPHIPPDSQPGQADSSGNVTDLRNLITGKKPLPKLELFTDKPCDITSQDVRNQAKEITEKNIKFSKAEKLRKLKKSVKLYDWKNYAPPEHQDGYVHPSKTKPTEDPEHSSSKCSTTAGARKASADHTPAGRGRSPERTPPIKSSQTPR